MNHTKAAHYDSRLTGRICVKFPHTDWLIKGRVFTGEPIDHRKPIIRGNEVWVKFHCRYYRVEASTYLHRDFTTKLPLRSEKTGRIYPARIDWKIVESRDSL